MCQVLLQIRIGNNTDAGIHLVLYGEQRGLKRKIN